MTCKAVYLPQSPSNQKPTPNHIMSTNSSVPSQGTYRIARRFPALVVTLLVAQSCATGYSQSTVVPPAPPEEKEPVILSPFVVSSDKDVGYLAANTLAGTRLNTNLFETPAAISVLTKELIDDIGAENTRDFLRFAMNAEQDDGAQGVGQNTQNSDVVVKIRGFSGGGMTRDYFSYGGGVLSDRFNVDRADLNRGPNAVLYGIGGPGGVINLSTKQAQMNGRQQSYTLTVGSFNKVRGEIDYGLPVVKDKLAFRFNAMAEDRNGWREFEFSRKQGGAVAVSYRPFSKTWIRGTWERVVADQSIPWQYPPQDMGGTRWLMAGSKVSGAVLPGTNPDVTTLALANNYAIMYAPQLRAQPFRLSTAGVDMRPDVAGNQSAGFWQTTNGLTSPAGGIVDIPGFGQIIPKRSNIMGEGSRADYDYDVGSVFLEQQLGDLALEVAYNRFGYHRDGRFLTTGLGLRADPNTVLPGAYYANGSWDARPAAGSQSPGTALPDIGVANPYVGSLYVEGSPTKTRINTDIETLRASLSYKLDLTKKSKWLGIHSLSFLTQSDEREQLVRNSVLYNVSPNDTFPVEHSSHQVFYRTYLDFNTPGGQRGAIDPFTHPLQASPGIDAQWVLNSNAPVQYSGVDTQMTALQSKFLDNRLVVTAGYRWDRQLSDRASEGGVRLPNSSSLWTRHHDQFAGTANQSVFRGETLTLGMFVAPFKWLGLTANKSDSVLPQSFINILHQPVKTRAGKGEDYGVRFSMLEQRAHLNVNFFKNNDTDRITFYSQLSSQFNPALNAIVTTQKRLGQPLPQVMRDVGTTDLVWTNNERDLLTVAGKGIEVELAGTIAKGWSVAFNYAHQNNVASQPAGYSNRFHADVKAVWDGDLTPLDNTPASVADWVRLRDGTPNRDFTLAPATFNDAYDFAGEVLKGINAQEGRPELLGVKDQCNVFTSYRFQDRDSWLLRGTRIGVGANYRSEPVIGFDESNNNATLYGDSTFLVNLMFGKHIPLKKGKSLDFQINVDNLLGDEDMQPYSAVTAGSVVRYIYPRTVRSWNFRMTVGF